MFSKTDYLFTKRTSFLFNLGKLGFYFEILNNNLAKLKDRQIPDIAIRLIVTNVFKTTVRIKKIKKTNESFIFIIITKGYFYWTLKNQLQDNIVRYSFKILRTDTIFLNITKHYGQYIYKIYKVKFNIYQINTIISF